MSEVVVKFLDSFEEPLIAEKKTMALRTRPFGQPGDYFIVFGHKFEITHVERVSLGFVETCLYKFEGFPDSARFKTVWQALHQRRAYKAEEKFYLHVFRRLEKVG